MVPLRRERSSARPSAHSSVIARPMSPDAESIQGQTLLAAQAFDNAKKKYFAGLPGPYVLAGRYSVPVFERLSRITESHWKMAYSHHGRQIILYGDPQPQHDLFSSHIRYILVFRLAQYLGAADAPPSGIPSFDDVDADEPPINRCLRLIDDVGSGRISLVPRWTQHGRTRHPSDRTRDSTIDKEGDLRLTVRGKYSATGVRPGGAPSGT
jgi:hypothetical protein